MVKFNPAQYRSKTNLSIELIPKIYFWGFLILAISLFYYQIIKGNYYAQRARNNYVRVVPLAAIRGSIFDRNKIVLAYDQPIYNISVIPYQIRDQKENLFQRLSKFISCDVSIIYDNYRRNLKSFFSPVDIIVALDKKTSLLLKEELGDLILINSQPQRYYTYAQNLSHLLGYVQPAASFYETLKKYGYTPAERTGISGIEHYYDVYLKGEDGGDLIEVDVRGSIVGFLGYRLPKRGKDIEISIDSRIQDQARNSLAENKGAIIFMDSLTGEILALYSSPSFDPNNFVDGKDINKIRSNKNYPLFNRAIQATYPIASTFKPLLGAAGLQEDKLIASKEFTCSGELKLGKAKFSCWDTHYQENLYDALAHSCNVYFYNLGLSLGPNLISKWAKKFGLDSYTGIDLPYEKKGFVPSVKWKQKKLKSSWFAGDTLNFSIGQGFIEATPLEITVAINALANGGYLVSPYILKKVDQVDSTFPKKTHVGISDKNLEIIKEGLRRAVLDPEGTSHLLRKLDLQIAGKTGTAQTKGKSHGWFVGFFPYPSPKYIICTFLEHGSSSYEALRVTKKFLQKLKEQNIL